MIRTISTSLVVCAVFLCNVPTSLAYTTTAQNAYKLTDTTGLYLIEFTFGHEHHEVYVPVAAWPTDSLLRGALSYRVVDDEGERVRGNTVGIVLGDLPIKSGMYVVPKGKAAKFTPMVLFSAAEDELGTSFWTEVTALPFSFNKTEELKLNQSELQYYRTPELELRNVPFTVSGVEILYTPLGDSGSLTSDNENVTLRTTGN